MPGDIQSKIDPYMQPLFDNLAVIRHQFDEDSQEFKRIAELLVSEKLLIMALEDDALRERMGKQARQDVLDRWEWRHHMAKLEGLYEEVQGDPKPPRDA